MPAAVWPGFKNVRAWWGKIIPHLKGMTPKGAETPQVFEERRRMKIIELAEFDPDTAEEYMTVIEPMCAAVPAAGTYMGNLHFAATPYVNASGVQCALAWGLNSFGDADKVAAT